MSFIINLVRNAIFLIGFVFAILLMGDRSKAIRTAAFGQWKEAFFQ